MRVKLLPIILSVSLGLASSLSVTARDVQKRPRTTGDAQTTVAGIEGMSVEERIERIERILSNQGLVDLLFQIEELKTEVQSLRGELELQAHKIEDMQQRQRDLYVDVDRRLLRIERNGGNVSTTGNEVTTVPVTVVENGSATTTSTNVTTTEATPVKPGDPANELKEYEKAFDLLKDLRYEQAEKAFRSFVAQYPSGRYSHIAQYWIGEINFTLHKYKQAIADYQKLIDDYPKSPKIADAMYKIGSSYFHLKNYAKAEAVLLKLIEMFPGTTEAGQAKNVIQQVRLKKSK